MILFTYFIFFSLIAATSEAMHSAQILNHVVTTKSSPGQNSAYVPKSLVTRTFICMLYWMLLDSHSGCLYIYLCILFH